MKLLYITIFIFTINLNLLYATFYFIGPGGSNNNSGISETQAWATFNHAVSHVNGGDTLIILDGTYYQSISIYKSGTESNPIVFRAKNDGKVTIDGQYEKTPVLITGNYIVIEGIMAQNSSADVYIIKGSYNIIRRCTGYNANNNNNHVFVLDRSTHILVEDCAGSGNGRYIFLNYNSTYNIFRRCFAKWEKYDSLDTDPRAGFCNYGAFETITENCIAENCIPTKNSKPGTDFVAFKQTHNEGNIISTSHNKYFGSIANNCATGFIAIGYKDYQNNSEFYNCLIINCKYYNSKNPYGFYLDAQDVIAKNITLVNNDPALSGSYLGQGSSWGSNMSFKNFVFLSNNIAIDNSFDWRRGNLVYSCFWNNIDNGKLPTNSTFIFTDPIFNTYNGDMNYCYIPKNSPCNGAGENGDDLGANIVYQYVNGELDTTPLWPWPMQERIFDEMDYDITSTYFPGIKIKFPQPDTPQNVKIESSQ